MRRGPFAFCRIIAILTGTVLALAVSPLGAQAATSTLVVRQAAYGKAAQQSVWVYRDSRFPGRRPTAYFIHGGGWVSGDHRSLDQEARNWAARGWVVINIDYRLSVSGKLMWNDITTVVSTYERKSYVDSKRQIMYGSSAGGHLATWVATKLGLAHFAGVIAWSPVASPYNTWRRGTIPQAKADDASLAVRAKRFFGYDWTGTTAITYAGRSTAPPTFLVGSRDEWVDWDDNGGALCKALGSKCTATVVAGDAHATGIGAAHPKIQQAARDWADALVTVLS